MLFQDAKRPSGTDRAHLNTHNKIHTGMHRDIDGSYSTFGIMLLDNDNVINNCKLTTKSCLAWTCWHQKIICPHYLTYTLIND